MPRILSQMFTHLKINTAILVCLVFIFRLLFVNINMLSASNMPQTNKLLAKYFSTIQKRKRHVEATVQSNVIDYTDVEVCEEGLDNEEDLIKVHSPVILSAFSSFLNCVTIPSKSNHPFGLIKCDLYPKKYLTLSALRI